MEKIAGKQGNGAPQTGPTVAVTIDTQEKQIHRGNYSPKDLKEALAVADGLELDQVIGGEFQPTEAMKHVVIKGGEIFVSHQPKGGSA
jgi:hypothetical protein